MSIPAKPEPKVAEVAVARPADAQARDWQRRLCEAKPTGLADVFVGIGLAALYLLLLLGTVSELGYARDEGFYFVAARAYQRWFELLWTDPATALAGVDATWRANHEHPALLKSLFGLSHGLAFERWQLFGVEGTSFRFPAMALASLGVGLVYLWGARARGRLVGLVAAVSLAAMPRFFFHAHLACFDAPVVTMWTLCAYAYWRCLNRGGWWWPVAVGLCFGLALNTKHNSWFLPIVCGSHAAFLQLWPLLARRGGRLEPGGRASTRRLRRRSIAALLSMGAIGPLVFYGTWPWLWHDTVARLQEYARFHLHHVYYNMEFLGRNYFEPPMPRSYAFVMTAATVPTITLLLFAVGLAHSGRGSLSALGRLLRQGAARLGSRRLLGAPAGAGEAVAPSIDALPSGAHHAVSERQRPVPAEAEPAVGHTAEGPSADGATSLLWLLALVVQYAAWLSPSTPIFGGTKHWMTAYPFLVLFAGCGLQQLVLRARAAWVGDARAPAWLRRATAGPLLEAGFAAAVLVAPATEALHAHPWGLSSYSPIVGGAAGGASLGLNRGFWGYTTGAVAPVLNARAPRRSRVFVHDTAGAAWDMMVRDGRLRRDLRASHTIVGADFGLYHHEKHMAQVEYQTWVAFGTATPVHVAGLDGVPVIWIYQSSPVERR